MGQEEIMRLLEKRKRPMSRGEIAKELKLNPIRISHTLNRLITSKEVKVIEINRFQAMEKYNCQRRLRLYYVSDI